MKFGVIPETVSERMALAANLVPTPLVDTQIAYTLARTVMVASKLGVFEALEAPATPDEVADRCRTHPRATQKLLRALAAARYLKVKGERFVLTRRMKKWLLPSSPHSLAGKLSFQFDVEWDLMKHYESFMKDGKPVDMHSRLTEGQWQSYQLGMRSMASMSAQEAAQRVVLPSGAQKMLDIGGSHGFFSVALCKKHKKLRSIILDLPEAVEQAAPLLEKENMGDRIVYRAGDARSEDLGIDEYDLAFASQVVHHFTETQNRDLARRVARALRPGGVFVIQETIRPETAAQATASPLGALLDMYFAITSESGTWSLEEIKNWQRDAGLIPQPPIWLRSMPGVAQQVGVKR